MKLHWVLVGFQALSENGRLLYDHEAMKLAIFWQEHADLSPLFLDNRV